MKQIFFVCFIPNLIEQYIFCPTKFFGRKDIKLTLYTVFTFVENNNMFCPANFSNQWLEIFFGVIFGVKLSHQPKIGSGEPSDSGKFLLQFGGKCWYNCFAPIFRLFF